MNKTKKGRTTSKVLAEVPKDPNQREIKKLFPRRKSLRKSLATTYYPVSNHIYYDGHSFRVRVRINGQTTSVSTPNKTQALKARKRLLSAK